MNRTTPFANLCLLLLLVSSLGCVGTYAGGPTASQPHGLVSAAADVTIWRIDGQDVTSRGSVYVAPGRRTVKVRLEYPIESESWKPFDYKDLFLQVEDGVEYFLSRKPSVYPPHEVQVRKKRFR